MADVGDILNDGEFFGDLADTPKEGIEQHKKREELKSVIDKSKAHLLGYKWTHEKLEKASDKTINKTYTEYRQRELNEEREKTRKALRSKHVFNLYYTGISQMVKIRDVHKLRQDIENDPIIKDQMASLGCLLVCIFDNLLAPVLVLAHTINNLDLGDESESEYYESKGP